MRTYAHHGVITLLRLVYRKNGRVNLTLPTICCDGNREEEAKKKIHPEWMDRTVFLTLLFTTCYREELLWAQCDY
jgi:hypothetical protein